jgi:hypothetical protein
MKTIPQDALTPLTELSHLLSQLQQHKEPITILKDIIQAMNQHSEYFFNQPWPQKYHYNQTTDYSPTDLDFINNQQQNEALSPLHLLCIKKNINHQKGFLPIGFLWTLRTLNQKPSHKPSRPTPKHPNRPFTLRRTTSKLASLSIPGKTAERPV